MRSESTDRPARTSGAKAQLEQERRRPERLGLLYPVLLFTLAVGAVALIVDNRARLVGGGYEIDTLREKLASLTADNRRLRLEISSLTGPEEVEPIAAELGLGPPAPGQVRSLPPAPKAGAR